MTITDDMHIAIAGARLQGEARIVTFAEKTRRAILAQNGVQTLSYDRPRTVALPQDTSASYWVEEMRPGLVCRMLTLSSRPAMGQPCALAQTDLNAVLGDYGFVHTMDEITAAGGVTRASSPEQQGTIITVVEPIDGNLGRLIGSDATHPLSLLDPSTLAVAVMTATAPMPSSIDREIAEAIDRIDTVEPS